MTNKQTPLTLEVFEKYVMPQINSRFNEINKNISHLPSKEEYFAREDKTMGELKKLREEVAMTNDLYRKTNKRVDIIDKNLGIDTSGVF